MATDKRGRKLPKGIRQRGKNFEGRTTFRGITYSVRGKTVSETDRKLTELKYRLSSGAFEERSKDPFDSWFNFWLNEYKKLRVKVGTYETYKQYYKSLIYPSIGKLRLCDIRPNDIQLLLNDLSEKGYSLSTLKIVHVLIRSCLHRAMLNEMIERNAADSIQLPRCVEPVHREALTKDQQRLFFEYAEGTRLFPFFSIMLRTGLRNGELRALKYSDIDYEENVLHIRRTLKYLDGRGYFEDSPKTRSSVRDIPLTEDIIAILDNCADENHSENDYIFKSIKGKPLGRDFIQYEIDGIVCSINENGHPFERITPHVFRHTFATRAIEAGMSPQVLKVILGHSSLAMTMDLYSHVMPDTKSEEMEKISACF